MRQVPNHLEFWRCQECTRDLRDVGGIATHVTVMVYDGYADEEPSYRVVFCDEECADIWYYRGSPPAEPCIMVEGSNG